MLPGILPWNYKIGVDNCNHQCTLVFGRVFLETNAPSVSPSVISRSRPRAHPSTMPHSPPPSKQALQKDPIEKIGTITCQTRCGRRRSDYRRLPQSCFCTRRDLRARPCPPGTGTPCYARSTGTTTLRLATYCFSSHFSYVPGTSSGFTTLASKAADNGWPFASRFTANGPTFEPICGGGVVSGSKPHSPADGS